MLSPFASLGSSGFLQAPVGVSTVCFFLRFSALFVGCCLTGVTTGGFSVAGFLLGVEVSGVRTVALSLGSWWCISLLELWVQGKHLVYTSKPFICHFTYNIATS